MKHNLVRQVRFRLGLSQREFAERYCLPLATLKNWEQDRYEQDAAAKLLFHLIELHPRLIAQAVLDMAKEEK